MLVGVFSQLRTLKKDAVLGQYTGQISSEEMVRKDQSVGVKYFQLIQHFYHG